MRTELRRAPTSHVIRRIAVDALQVASTPTGVGRQVKAIGAALAAAPADLELELRCTREAAPLLALAFPERTRIRTPIAASRPRWRRAFRQLVLEAATDSPDTLLVCLGDQAPPIGRARVVLVVNDLRRLTHPKLSGRAERLWYRMLVPLAARHATTLVTISDFSQRELQRVLGRPAAVVAHHPAPAVSTPAASPGGGPLVVVGALRLYKGGETVIDALALLDPGARRRVFFCGPDEGAGRALRQRALESGVGSSVEFLGWIGDDELERLVSSAAATVNPSLYEGYGLAVAESLARGLPTLASAIPAHLEVGGDAVLTFPPGDARALAKLLRRLDDAAFRADLAERAFRRSHELTAARPTWAEVLLTAAGRATSAQPPELNSGESG